MGTIVQRARKDGSVGYTAQIRIKRGGRVAFTEARTFDSADKARRWMVKREAEMLKPGALDAVKRSGQTLSDLIDAYVKTFAKDIGRTKAQVLEAVKGYSIGEMVAEEITSAEIVAFARTLGHGRQPQTVLNYLSHLSSVFSVARAAWGVQIDRNVMRDAMEAAKHFGLTQKSLKRERRPTIEELDRLMAHFGGVAARRSSMPMQKVVLFAIYSARRQEEITRIRWDDLEPGRVLVRDMKHPGDKRGNDQWCLLVPEAEAVALSMPRVAPEIFPFTTDAISAAFTRACKVLEIQNLRFHDLRHEAASRLFEMGWTIPRVAEVTGHRTWQSLQRYSHLRQTGDKLAGWRWAPETTKAPPDLSGGAT